MDNLQRDRETIQRMRGRVREGGEERGGERERGRERVLFCIWISFVRHVIPRHVWHCPCTESLIKI